MASGACLCVARAVLLSRRCRELLNRGFASVSFELWTNAGDT
jgi:hypothetical protein